MQRLVLRAVPRALPASRHACIAAAASASASTAPRVRARFYSDAPRSGAPPSSSSSNPFGDVGKDGRLASSALEHADSRAADRLAREDDDADLLEDLSESLQEAIRTGDESKLSDEDRALLRAYTETGVAIGANDEAALLQQLPAHLRRAVETGDLSGLSQEEAAVLSSIFSEEEGLPSEILANLPEKLRMDIATGAQLSEQDMALVQKTLEDAGYDVENRDEVRSSLAQSSDKLLPQRIPAHWARALQSGNDAAIPAEERPAFEQTRTYLYAKRDRESGSVATKVGDEPLAVSDEVIKALQTGDIKRIPTADLERVARAADQLQASQPQSPLAAIDNLMKDPTGAVLDPTGGPTTSGRRVGPDDIFTTKEIKYLAERKRLEAIDRATRAKPRWLGPPEHIPRTYHIPVAVVHFRSHELPLIELYIHFVTHTAAALGIPCSKPAFLPRQRSLWTVLKSPFIYKKIQQNFHRITYKRAIKLWDADSEVVTFFIDYITRHTLGGVGVRIVRWDRGPIDVGQQIWLNATKHPKSTSEMLAHMTRRVRKAESQAAARLQAGVEERSWKLTKRRKKVRALEAWIKEERVVRAETWVRMQANIAAREEAEDEARAVAAEANEQVLVNGGVYVPNDADVRAAADAYVDTEVDTTGTSWDDDS